MSDTQPERSKPQPRKGAVPRPVQPVDAVVLGVNPLDPLHLGRATFRYRRPLTSNLLENEFRLTRKQAHAIAVHTTRHGSVRRQTRRAALKYWGLVLLLTLSLGLILVFFAGPVYIDWASSVPDSDPGVALISLALGVLIAFSGLALWLIAERRIMDRIVNREIRRCWREQECLWCGRDMTGCVVDRERWSRCPECGMRSPIGARASTI